MQRWGILGTSFISDTVAQTIVDHPECHLQAVAGRRKSAVLKFAQQYKIGTTYTDYEQLINDDNIDIVYIGLPNHLHHQYTKLALAANKDVLCEKSLSVDMLKTDEIVTAVKDSANSFIEGLMYVHHPYFKALINRLKSGELGEITQICASYCVDIAQFVNAQGGGVIFDLGCYPMSSVQCIMQSIYGQDVAGSAVLKARGEFDILKQNIIDASVKLTFANSVVANIHCAEAYDEQPLFVIETSKVRIELINNVWMPDAKENKFKISVMDDKEENEEVVIKSEGDAFYYQTQQFLSLIAEKGKNQLLPYPNIDASKAIMALLTQWDAQCRGDL